MWPFKRKKVWRSPRPKHRPPFGDFCVGEIVVRVWLNESFSNLDRTRTRWGFSFNRVIRGRYVNSFRMRDLADLERAARQLREFLERKDGAPFDMEVFLRGDHRTRSC